jgi:hypothetical protein
MKGHALPSTHTSSGKRISTSLPSRRARLIEVVKLRGQGLYGAGGRPVDARRWDWGADWSPGVKLMGIYLVCYRESTNDRPSRGETLPLLIGLPLPIVGSACRIRLDDNASVRSAKLQSGLCLLPVESVRIGRVYSRKRAVKRA